MRWLVVLALALSGCLGPVVVHEPILCPAWTEQTQADFEQLKAFNRAPSLRAWVVDAGQTCKANASMRSEEW